MLIEIWCLQNGENKTEKDGEDEDEEEDEEVEVEESSDDDYNQVSILELETLCIEFFDVGKWVLGGTQFSQKYLISMRAPVTSTNTKWIHQLCIILLPPVLSSLAL